MVWDDRRLCGRAAAGGLEQPIDEAPIGAQVAGSLLTLEVQSTIFHMVDLVLYCRILSKTMGVRSSKG